MQGWEVGVRLWLAHLPYAGRPPPGSRISPRLFEHQSYRKADPNSGQGRPMEGVSPWRGLSAAAHLGHWIWGLLEEAAAVPLKGGIYFPFPPLWLNGVGVFLGPRLPLWACLQDAEFQNITRERRFSPTKDKKRDGCANKQQQQQHLNRASARLGGRGGRGLGGGWVGSGSVALHLCPALSSKCHSHMVAGATQPGREPSVTSCLCAWAELSGRSVKSPAASRSSLMNLACICNLPTSPTQSQPLPPIPPRH